MTTQQIINEASMPQSEQSGRRNSENAESSQRINVGSVERLGSVAAGAFLALKGAQRRSLPGLAMMILGGVLIQRGASGHCAVSALLGRNSARSGPPEAGSGAVKEEYFERGIHVEQSMTVNRPREELYRFWRNFENLPRFMEHLREVKVLDGDRSLWIARGPAGMSVQWYAEIINDEPNEAIAWRSLDDAQVDNAGSVRFIDTGDRGTEVRAVVDYIPPAGRLGAAVARLLGQSPDQQIREDLGRFKQMMETGEVATIQGQPQGA